MTSYSARDNALVEKLDRMFKDQIAMKASQPTGRSNTITKQISTPLILSAITAPGNWQTNSHRVTFEAQTQLSPYARIGVAFYTTSMVKITDTSKIYGYVSQEPVGIDDKQYKWLIVSSTPPGDLTAYYMQITVSATDNGSIVYERVA